MDNQQLFNAIMLKNENGYVFNRSWFSREMYPDRKGAEVYLHTKLRDGKMKKADWNKLNLVFKKLSNLEI